LTAPAAAPIVVAMKGWLTFVVGGLAFAASGSQAVSACGDKFLLVGRGVRFEQAYAAIHPASILIVLPARSVKSAAVRDARLVTALKNAGHRVEVVQPSANLADALSRSRRDIILVEQADAAALHDITAAAGQAKPSIVGVLEDPTPSALSDARQRVEYVLPTPTSLSRILNLMDDVMKARLDGVRRNTAGS
jgi:hypothetical protein